MPKILVTGGCGYIGSHTIVVLLERGFDVVCLDNLSNASEDALDGIEQITGKRLKNHEVDLSDRNALRSFLNNETGIDAVIHFAALKAVGESVEKPMLYFTNNVGGMINLLAECSKHGINDFIFSSSCTVYGQPEKLPVTETSPFLPAESPYGRTKQIGEYLLKDLAGLEKIRAISLRYFNPAGAHTSAHIGERSIKPALNLVPIIVEAASGKRSALTIYGDDYDTRDGTCIRDYIHVMDLAEAHVKALEYLENNHDVQYDIFNLGTGEGTTVNEAINAFQKATNINVPYNVGPRRSGDITSIYSDNERAEYVLGWKPVRSIDDIMLSAWNWDLTNKNSKNKRM